MDVISEIVEAIGNAALIFSVYYMLASSLDGGKSDTDRIRRVLTAIAVMMLINLLNAGK